MKNPKPKLRSYLKERFQHPFKSLYDLIYTDDSGNLYQESFNPQAAIINIAAVLLISTSVIFLNCTILYIVLTLIFLYILRYLRYFYAKFTILDENNKPVEECKAYTFRQKLMLATEVVLMLLITIGSCYLFNTSAYARKINGNDFNIGETFLKPTNQYIESFEQAYKESKKFSEADVPSAFLTHYGTQVHSEGKDYYFVFTNFHPSLFIKRSNEFEILLVWTNQRLYKGCLSFCRLDYQSPYSEFKPLELPITEIHSQKVIEILYDNTDLANEKVEYYYIGTHFLTDLPKLSAPGGDTLAVQILIGDELQYYTVNIAEGTAVLEKTAKLEYGE